MNVVPITRPSTQAPKPEEDLMADLFQNAIDSKFTSALIIGELDGSVHLMAANISGPNALWNMEQAKRLLMSPPDNGNIQ